MSDRVKVFWSEPSEHVRVSLRRFYYSPRADGTEIVAGRHRRCAATPNGCDASVGIIPSAPREDWIRIDEQGDAETVRGVSKEHTGWPLKCEACGEPMGEGGEWQVNADRLYAGGGQLFTLRDPPVGAMYDASWYTDFAVGFDGLHLVVICPDGHPWLVDAEASNCTMKGDRSHRCWVRHGDPRTGEVHVDKDGATCSAGGGSIQTAKWHGYLHHGYLHT